VKTPRPLHAGLALLVFALAAPRPAAAKTVVVLGVSGPRGGQAAQLVTRALAGRYRVVGRGAFIRAAQQQGGNHHQASGRSAAARALRVDGIISGSMTRAGGRWVLRIVVCSGHSGRQVGSATFPLRGTRLDPTTAHRVPSGIARAMARARAGPPVAGYRAVRVRRPKQPRRRRPSRIAVRAVPVPRAPPQRGGFDDGTDLGDEPAAPVAPAPVAVAPPVAPVQAAGDDGTGFETPPALATPRVGGGNRDDLGFEVSDEQSDDNERVPSYREKGPARNANEQFRISRKTSERPEWETVFELGVGVMAVNRKFDFNEPIYPAKKDEHSNYRSGLVPALMIDAAIYPLAFFHRGPLANLGLVGRYYRVLGLKSQPPLGEPVHTTLHTFEMGLRYRWNMLGRLTSPTLNAGVEFGRLGFVIWDDETNFVPLPDIVNIYLKLALVGLEVPFYAKNNYRIGAMGSFDYLLIFSSGEIENTDSAGYGRSSTGGIEIGLGMFGSYGGFFVKAGGFYRRIFYDFDNNCYNTNLSCKAAGGALDVYMGGSVLAGYAY